MCGEKKERFTSEDYVAVEVCEKKERFTLDFVWFVLDRFFCMTSIELENHVQRTEDMAQNINLPINVARAHTLNAPVYLKL